MKKTNIQHNAITHLKLYLEDIYFYLQLIFFL